MKRLATLVTALCLTGLVGCAADDMDGPPGDGMVLENGAGSGKEDAFAARFDLQDGSDEVAYGWLLCEQSRCAVRLVADIIVYDDDEREGDEVGTFVDHVRGAERPVHVASITVGEDQDGVSAPTFEMSVDELQVGERSASQKFEKFSTVYVGNGWTDITVKKEPMEAAENMSVTVIADW